MTLEKWIVHPGDTRVIDIETVRKLQVGLVGGQEERADRDVAASLRAQAHDRLGDRGAGVVGDGGEVGGCVDGQVGALGKVLA